jgi:TPP-dependent 2-oxoacid decarboxylase
MGLEAYHVSTDLSFLRKGFASDSTSFVLNNGGYTVERLIHGKDAFYNEVAILDYSMLAKAFGPAFASKYHGPIKTCGELTKLLSDSEFGHAGCFEVRSSFLEDDGMRSLMLFVDGRTDPSTPRCS